MIEYQWWRDALTGNRAPIHDGEPQAGFYRTKRGRVAYWHDSHDGTLRCQANGADLSLQAAHETWPWAAKTPVSVEAFRHHEEHGRWPGDHEAVIGNNVAPPDNSIEGITERIADLAREAERMIAAGAATSQDISDQASDLANTFGELENKVTALHKIQKEPHLEAGRVVDRKWFGLRDTAADLKKRLKAIVVTPWLVRRKAEVDAANVAAIASGTDPAALPQQRTTAGSSKRQSAIRTYYRAEIEDWAKLFDSLREHPDVVACIQRIADAAAAKKVALPGCKVIAEQRAA